MSGLSEFKERIENNPKISNVRFNQAFLDDVGNVVENKGFDAAKIFIWEHHERRDLSRQVESLLLILDELAKVRAVENDRSIAKYIIKNKLDLLLK